MKKQLLLFISLFLMVITAKAGEVTFQVDMNHIADMYNGGEVWVYMDAGWNEYYTLTDENSDGIYTYTDTKIAGTNLTFRYAYQTGPDANTQFVTENVPGDCSNENGFRTIVVPSANKILDTVAYGSCTQTPNTKVKITFKVDMSAETDISDVQVVIKDPWIWTGLADQGNGIWQAEVEVDANSKYPYTFVNGGQDNWSGEESVPAECNFGTESAPQREVNVFSGDTILAIMPFGGCSGTTEKSTLVFNVDMNAVSDLYPKGGVWVYMDNDWTEYYDMTDGDGDGIYSYTVEKEAGITQQYSFAYQTGADPNNDFTYESVPGECANAEGYREVVISAGENILPSFALGSCSEVAPAKVMVTFSVDMSEASNPNNVQVVIKNPWIWTSLTNDGGNVWSADVALDANGTYPYTFVNGGQDNWTGEESVDAACNKGTESAPERHVMVTDADMTLETVLFGKCTTGTGIEDALKDHFEVYPNPANTDLSIKSLKGSIQAIRVYDLQGKEQVHQHYMNAPMVQLNVNNLTQGVYMMRVEGISETYNVKIIISHP